MQSKLIIIILNFLGWEDTLECVNSLIINGIDESCILVIDNCSPNDSYNQLISHLPLIKIIQTKENLGFSGGNNIGIRYALGKGFQYAILLNNDTIVEKNAIKSLINEMDNNLDVTLGTGQIRYYHDKNKIWYAGGKLIPWRGLAVHVNINKDYKEIIHPTESTCVSFISGCFMCIRTAHLKDLGLLNESFFIYLEDIEYSARAVNKKMKLLYVPNSIIYHKWRGETKLKYQTLYYVVRNRKLLIDISFPKIAKLYFETVILSKMIMWYFIDKKLFNAARHGLKDYRNNYFGPIKLNTYNKI